METSWTLGQIAEITSGSLRGDPEVSVSGIAPLHAAEPGQLTWASSPRFARQLSASRARAALVAPEVDAGERPAVVCEHIDRAVARVLAAMQPPVPHPPPGVHPRAFVADGAELDASVGVGPLAVVQAGARIGPRSCIHAGAIIGERAVIGEDCIIWSNAVIREGCVLGNRVIIHPNVTIGADGFGYYFAEGRYERIPQIGTVRIEDDVDVGANSCVDRAKCGETVIGRGCKIDNLVQVGHNCQVGEHSCLAAQVGIAGSTRLGSHVLFGGQVGVRDNVEIGSRAQVAACACIAADVEGDETYGGIPAVERALWLRQTAAMRRLPETTRMVRNLLKRVQQLEAADD